MKSCSATITDGSLCSRRLPLQDETRGVSRAQEARFELGFRGLVLLGKGTPANDMIGEGLVGRCRFERRVAARRRDWTA